MGWLSVCPSTRTGFGYFTRVAASASSAGIALSDRVATPLANRMSVRTSTSSQNSWRRPAGRGGDPAGERDVGPPSDSHPKFVAAPRDQVGVDQRLQRFLELIGDARE